MIPIIPAIKVKNMDSIRIWFLTCLGVAPNALRMPISFVLSLTDINNIFPIPITPANIVTNPTIRERNDKPLTKFRVSLKTLPKLNPPNASSSLGFISFISYNTVLTSFSTFTTSTLS